MYVYQLTMFRLQHVTFVISYVYKINNINTDSYYIIDDNQDTCVEKQLHLIDNLLFTILLMSMSFPYIYIYISSTK